MKCFANLIVFLAFSQILSANSYDSGYYYNADGKKIEGYIKFVRATFSVFGSKQSHILFRKSEDDKSVKLTADDISSFVLGNDSFTIVRNITINSVQGEYKADFAKVLISGKMNLYLHMSESNDGRSNYKNDRYVLSKDNKTFFGIWNAKEQRFDIANFFSDDPEIKTRILNKEFDKKIPELVQEYNSNAK